MSSGGHPVGEPPISTADRMTKDGARDSESDRTRVRRESLSARGERWAS
jgi:hypothetical protein